MPVNPPSRAALIAQYGAQIDAMFPPGPSGSTGQGPIVDLGQEYINYMNKHPKADPKLIYDTVIARIELLQSVPSGIASAVGAGAGAASGLTQAGTNAIPSIYPAWLQGFLGANGLLRIAEGALGLLIIAVSLDKLLGGNAGVVTKIAKVVK